MNAHLRDAGRAARARWLSCVALTAVGLAIEPASAQLTSTTWQGPGNTGWNTAGNWSSSAVPTGNTVAAVINGSLGGGSPINLTTSPNIGGFTLASGFTLTRSANTNRTLTLSATTAADTVFDNAGTISTGQTGGSITISINYLAGTIVNSGTMEATADTGLFVRSSATNNGFTLTNTGGVLRTVGSGTLSFADINGGINVTGGSISNSAGRISHRRTTTLTDVTFSNGGIFESLAPTTAAGQQYNIVLAGTSALSNTGTMTFTKDVMGMNVTQANSLRIVSGSASLTNSGSMYFATIGTATSGFVANTALQVNVSTTLTNNGVMMFESLSDTNLTTFSVGANTVTLSGSGTLALAVGTGGSASRAQIGGGNNSELINGASHTIRGAGALGSNGLATLTNNGTIHADDGTPLTALMRGGTSGLFTNASTGVVRASGAGGLVFSSSNQFTNQGLVQIDAGSLLDLGPAIFSTPGELKVNGSLTAAGPLSVAGILSGTGVVAPAVTVAGILAPGNSIGTLSTGALTLGGASTFEIELGRVGLVPVSDRAVVTGGVTIASGANLSLSLAEGLSSPLEGDLFFLLDNASAGAISGVFTSLNGVATTLTEGSEFSWNSQTWQITYQADAGSSSFTGGNDVAILAVVPEPATWVSLASAAALLATLTRRRRR